MTRTSRRRAALALLAAVALASPLPGGPAAASCAAPSLAVSGGDRLEPGAEVVVTGRGYVDGCDDTGGGDAFGCGTEAGEVEKPLTGVELVLRQDDRRWRLGTADAGTADDGRLGQVRWEVVLPDGVRPGRAVLRAAYGEPLEVRVTGR